MGLYIILRAEGMYNVHCTPQYIPTQASSLKAVYDRFLIMNPSMGMYQEIHPNPCWVIGIVSVEIYTSLVMLRE